MAVKIENTEEYELLEANQLPINEDDVRIMVIGDSYIHGGGINFSDNLSQQLKKMFKEHPKTDRFNDVGVLDVSKPSANNLDNNLTYFKYVDNFKPTIVILGYNINDIEGNLDKNEDTLKKGVTFGKSAPSAISRLYSIVKQSKLVGLTMNKTHRWFNSLGIIIPGSKFDENMKIYYQDKAPWIKSKSLLAEIVTSAEKDSVSLIVYKFQDMSVNPKIMVEANTVINEYFEAKPGVTFINGNDIFDSKDFKQYQLSKYDGHPNEKAHLKMASEVYRTINEELLESQSQE